MRYLMMLRSVEEVAIELGVSKTTIYNKLKLKKYNELVVKKQGISMIDDELLKLIKDNLRCKPIVDNEHCSELGEDEVAVDKADLINFNKELIGSLLNQLMEKDKQIADLHKLVENSQVLLKEEQKHNQSQLLLEEHFKEVDLKLQSIMREKREIKERNNRHIFSFFRRSNNNDDR